MRVARQLESTLVQTAVHEATWGIVTVVQQRQPANWTATVCAAQLTSSRDTSLLRIGAIRLTLRRHSRRMHVQCLLPERPK